MSLLEFFAYLAIGKVWIWLLQVNGLTRPIWNLHPKLTELGDCDLCLGFWVYLALGFALPPPFDLWPWWAEVVILAGVSAFVVHLLSLGWVSKFGVTIV